MGGERLEPLVFAVSGEEVGGLATANAKIGFKLGGLLIDVEGNVTQKMGLLGVFEFNEAIHFYGVSFCFWVSVLYALFLKCGG